MADRPTVVFMGVDVCHHTGVLQSSAYLPLSPPVVQMAWKKNHCAPFFGVARNDLFPDHAASTERVPEFQELNTYVVCAQLTVVQLRRASIEITKSRTLS
ncbi:hypothetical protein PG994_008013 [Apiospora phragmitis]|uniref:Piwi domain-containing protein n=1 Tax=Apiospora phragmitis TaxID=2905665 RepID=A0ABR1URW8_9PEZI